VSRAPLHANDGFDGASASVTLRGSVARIIRSVSNNCSDSIEILIDGAETLYREIRINNLLKDLDGNDVTLQPGSEVEITIKFRTGP
jgi:hypothetical protein